MSCSRLILPLLVPSLLAFGCGDETIDNLEGRLVAEEAVDFGDVQVGIRVPYALKLENGGRGALAITSIETDENLCQDGYEFEIEGTCDRATLAQDTSIQLAPSQTRELIISFQAFSPAETAAETTIRLVTNQMINGAPMAFTVRITARGVESGIEIAPNPVDFGRVLVGSSRTLSVDITNRLGSPVELFSGLDNSGKPEIINTGRGLFELLEPSPDPTRGGSLLDPDQMLENGETLQVQLRYTPDASAIVDGQDNARWIISNCDNNLCNLAVPLIGRGTNAAIRCAPEPLDFGQVNPGATSTRISVCTNVATEPVTVLGWEQEVGSSPNYSVTPYRGQVTTLGPNQTFDLEVTFSPDMNSAGTMPQGAVVVHGRNPIAGRNLDDTRVALRGESGGANIEVLPANLAFGQVALGTTMNRRILISNVGFNDLTITDIDDDLARTGAFGADRMSFIVPPGATEIVTVSFTPSIEGSISSELLITSNDGDEPEIRVPLVGVGIRLPPCSYQLQPARIEFGIVQVLRSTTQGLRIENTGNDACLINDVRLLGGSDPVFSLPDGNITTTMLLPGEAITVLAAFTPEAEQVYAGDLGFYISDPANSNPEVPLTGVGSAAALLISPNEIDFGQVGVNCATRNRVITIYNTGTAPTVIERIERPAGVSTEFELTSLPAGIPAPPGISIAPGQSIDFSVRYRARDEGMDNGFIHVFERGQTGPYVIPVFGQGAVDPLNEDHFEQLETPEVDILFVIDNSCSMGEEQASLTANFQSFIQFADNQALDYQIAVVSTDLDFCPTPAPAQRFPNADQGQCGYFADGGSGGAANPAWRLITPDEAPTPEQAFSAIATQGTNGSGNEQGLEAAYKALSSPLITGWNGGFLRPNAYLAMVFISDEEDQSPNAVDYYVNYFKAIKGFRNTNLFSASAIVGDAGTGCGGGQADPGQRYISTAQQTGGIFQSICTSDWATALENLGLSVFGYKSRFFLTNQPVPGTVTVEVDGVMVDERAPSGQIRWSHDPVTNTLNFAPLAIPEPGSEIIVRYRPECLP